jgi:polysaccharide export outer membrane protein
MFVQKRPHPGRSRVVPLAILLGLTLGIACAGTPSEGPPAPPIASADDYRISPGDELRILIYPDPPVDRLVKVRDDGRVSIDLIGDLDVAGRTPSEVATAIEGRAAKFIRHARATVLIEAPASRGVAIVGEVKDPSVVRLDQGMRVSEALAQVGGVTELAAASRIRLLRRNATQTEVHRVNLDRIADGDSSTDFLLADADLLIVPPASTVEVGYALRRALYPLEQLLRSILGGFFPAVI